MWNRRPREMIRKQPHLSGFACAFDAFKGDEERARYRAASLKMRTRRFGSVPVDRDWR